jgi:exopolysaccharide biosynthesis polyprenyl glycosylphosphotransferase
LSDRSVLSDRSRTQPEPPRRFRRVAPAGIEPHGGGLFTLVADLTALVAVYALVRTGFSATLPAVPSADRLLHLGLLAGFWIVLGTWRSPHIDFMRCGLLRNLARVGWHFAEVIALACGVLTLIPGVANFESPELVALFLGGMVGLLTVRYTELSIVRLLSVSIPHRHRILFIGNNARTRQMLADIRENSQNGVAVVGVLDPSQCHPANVIRSSEVPYLGPMDKLPEFLYSGLVDEVVVTLPVRSHYQNTEKVLKACSAAGIRAHVLSDMFNIEEPRRELSNLGGTRTLAYARGPARTWRIAIKRQFDVIASLAAIIVLGPLMALIALAIKLTSRGPVLFRQTRSGLNGRTFQVLKFRTMCIDAEEKRNALLQKNEVSGPVFKIARDPRITWLGRFLRKYSLDELPQLFNVLAGQMAIVGPRPPIPEEVKKYNFWQLRRLSMRPGLTCLWQVSGRNRIGFEEWMRLDLRYIDNWSLTLDVLILLRTVPTVLMGTGM